MPYFRFDSYFFLNCFICLSGSGVGFFSYVAFYSFNMWCADDLFGFFFLFFVFLFLFLIQSFTVCVLL